MRTARCQCATTSNSTTVARARGSRGRVRSGITRTHGQAEPQVRSGLSGLFLIDGFIDEWYPSLLGAQERFLLLKDIQLPGADDAAPKTKTINGS